MVTGLTFSQFVGNRVDTMVTVLTSNWNTLTNYNTQLIRRLKIKQT